MVRVKHRYLLVTILYPNGTSPSSQSAKSFNSNTTIPDTVLFHSPSPSTYTEDVLRRLVQTSVSDLFGDYGSGMISGSFKIMYHSQATSTSILRVSRESFRIVWAALTMTTHLPKPVNAPCVIQVLRVSGTIRKSEEAAIEFSKALLRRARMEGEDQARELLSAMIGAAEAHADASGGGADIMDIDEEEDSDD